MHAEWKSTCSRLEDMAIFDAARPDFIAASLGAAWVKTNRVNAARAVRLVRQVSGPLPVQAEFVCSQEALVSCVSRGGGDEFARVVVEAGAVGMADAALAFAIAAVAVGREPVAPWFWFWLWSEGSEQRGPHDI